MTTIVLTHPNDCCPRFHVFAVYDGAREQRTFSVFDVIKRDEAEVIAQKMMELYQADHFQRVMPVSAG